MRKNLLSVLGAIVLLAMIVGANVGQIKTIEYGIGLDAERKALQWSEYLAAAIPEIDQLLVTGNPTPEQATKIGEVVNYGDVFRFTLFDSTGREVLSLDKAEAPTTPAESPEPSPEALKVLQTGESRVSQNDSGERADRPALYAEAYVPIRSATGIVVGVAEVYLDQTAIAAGFSEAAFRLAVVLTIAFSSALCLLYLAYSIKKRQGNQVRQRADYLAKYDLLSSLHNRAGFGETVETMQRKGQIVPATTAVMFVDIDHFKQVNDTYGHKAGDAFLKHVGEAIAQCLGPNDTAGRLGGDEFVIVAQRPDLAGAEALAEQLRAGASKQISVNGTTISGNLSLGLHYAGAPEQTIDERMNKADLALYQAKMDGRNTYRVFTPELELRVSRRRKVEAAILAGIDQGLFAVHFQPLLSQTTKACIGFEALLRLTDSDGQSIPPVEFIPIAESIGAINQIGEWVLQRSAEAASEWPEPLFVAVNLSARQFDGGNLVGVVKNVLNSTGLSAKRLELEITESLLMDNTESVGDQLAALRALGVAIAMDDFGTGYSSLGYLWKFGFDKLKIDQSFMAGLSEDGGRAKEILETIIVLGHRLNMVVTAEGVETEGQADALSEMACDQFQGFLYGKAMPQADLAPYLLTNAAKTARKAPPAPDAKSGTGTAG